MTFYSILLSAALLVAATSATKFSDCGSKTGHVTRVEVSDCDDSQATCVLKRGTTKDISIAFTSSEVASKVTAVVHGVISGVPMPFRLPKPDGCKSGLNCPLVKDQSYQYSNKLEIKDIYPPISVTVRWELKDEHSTDLVCVEIPAKIE